MNDLPIIIIAFLLAVVLSLPWAYGFLDARTFSPVEWITVMNLASGCQLQYYTPPVQPESTLVLTCPGMDMMWLWPLPVEQQWSEDEAEGNSANSPLGRGIASRLK